MTEVRTRKNKENPHYGFLISWEPKREKKAHVKGETKFDTNDTPASIRRGKKADFLAQAEIGASIKKDVVRSLIIISLILILELVVYLAWNRFVT